MIELKGISKSFETHQVLENVNCAFEPGKIYGIIGKNGEGKSTLLRIINGIYEADSGEVLFDGKKLDDTESIKQNLVFVSDDSYFFRGYNIADMAEFYAALYPKFDVNIVVDLTTKLKLDKKAKISTFSKGMKRQTSLILAIATNAEYMFFDETFDGLDPINRNIMKNVIQEKAKKDNKAIIMTSHNMKELQDICDVFGILYNKTLSFEKDIKIETKENAEVIKIQISFPEKFDKTKFSELNVLDYEQFGSVAKLIVKGNKEEIISKLRSMNPVLLETLDLSLEEKLVYEMGDDSNEK